MGTIGENRATTGIRTSPQFDAWFPSTGTNLPVAPTADATFGRETQGRAAARPPRRTNAFSCAWMPLPDMTDCHGFSQLVRRKSAGSMPRA